jgi:hypothetical protein
VHMYHFYLCIILINLSLAIFLACKPCLAELHALNIYQKLNPDRYKIICINPIDGFDAINNFMQEHSYHFINLQAPKSFIEKLQIVSFPTQIILGNKGDLL